MYKVYTLSIAGGVFYVGCTRKFLAERLSGHLSSQPQIKTLPYWMKKRIEITEIWKCSAADATHWEKYWIKYYISSGAWMLNANGWKGSITKPKKFKQLLPDERAFIAFWGYKNTAALVGVTEECIRQLVKLRKQIRIDHHKKIFSLYNHKIINKFNENRPEQNKINLEG
jgi:hypothetical protein